MKLFVFSILLTVVLLACSKSKPGSDNNPPPSCSGTQSFATDVNPIIQSTCAVSDCHAAGSVNGPGALTTYQQIFNHRAAIRTAVANGTMPKTGSLSVTQKNAILCWIDNGAPNN